jgi:hypothetical protein
MSPSSRPTTTRSLRSSNQVGGVNVNLPNLLSAAGKSEPPFDFHFDDAPTFYVNGQPARSDPKVRQFERDLVSLTAPDPYVDHGAPTPVGELVAGTVGEKALHMVNSDPSRTPTFMMFGTPDFLSGSTRLACGSTTVRVNPGFAWNHGASRTRSRTRGWA